MNNIIGYIYIGALAFCAFSLGVLLLVFAVKAWGVKR